MGRSLEDIRRDLDKIDRAIHDLIMDRTLVIREVAEAKAAQNGGEVGFALRAGREAQMLRALQDRHKGELPFPVIARLWREIINAKTNLQAPFEVVLSLGDDTDDDAKLFRLDLARNHVGSSVPLRWASAADAMADLLSFKGGSDLGKIAVFGADDQIDGQAWWRRLADIKKADEGRVIDLVARLPFWGDGETLFAVAPVAHELSGDDLFVSMIEGDVPADAPSNSIVLSRQDDAHLIATPQPVADGVQIGAYAAPLDL